MTSITCALACLGGVELPSDPKTWQFGERDITTVFASESDGDVNLTLESPLQADLDMTIRAVDTFMLHTALARLTGNAKQRGPVKRVGVIYAGEYRPFPSMFGIMFDRGFIAPGADESSREFNRVAREGCAVFVDAITQFRSKDPAAVTAELQFTTVHELGHVFNLEHSHASPNFMTTSEIEAPPDSTYYQFVERHRTFLRQCSTQPCIAPGGSNYGDRADIGESFDPAQNGNAVAGGALRKLKLRVRLTKASFWYCEPIELEIFLALPKRSRDRCRVPDRVDPGYGEFAIWIEEPSGDRRRYRSPKFFCALPRMRTITATEPFARDLSIFGQSGGYTFRRSGIHRLWATLRLSPRRILTSNAISFEVRPPGGSSHEWRTLEPLLRAGASLLYYRASGRLSRAMKIVEQICITAPKHASAATARYALGRAHASAALYKKSNRVAHARLALKQLERAEGSGQLGEHSACLALEWMERMKEFARTRRVFWQH
jgi:hypothetical protein